MTKEEMILNYMTNLDISRGEAIQLIEDDENDEIGEEGEAMTEKAKTLKRYEKSEKERKKTVKEHKVDEEKKKFLEGFRIFVEGCGGSVTSLKNEAEFSFNFGENAYTVKLVKHRPPKK